MIAFRDLWAGHPINESVIHPCIAPRDLTNLAGEPIKTGFPTFANQCAIRLGVALKRAGVSPIRGLTSCGVHSPDEMHYIRAHQLANALVSANIAGVASVEKIRGHDVTKDFYPKLFGRTGLIFIRDYWHRGTDRQGAPTGDHIDVWNGYRSSAKWLMEWFSWLGYYSNYAEAREVWFWEVK